MTSQSHGWGASGRQYGRSNAQSEPRITHSRARPDTHSPNREQSARESTVGACAEEEGVLKKSREFAFPFPKSIIDFTDFRCVRPIFALFGPSLLLPTHSPKSLLSVFSPFRSLQLEGIFSRPDIDSIASRSSLTSRIVHTTPLPRSTISTFHSLPDASLGQILSRRTVSTFPLSVALIEKRQRTHNLQQPKIRVQRDLSRRKSHSLTRGLHVRTVQVSSQIERRSGCGGYATLKVKGKKLCSAVQLAASSSLSSFVATCEASAC